MANVQAWIQNFAELKNVPNAAPIEVIAHHEAGHAVAAYICKLSLVSMNVRPDSIGTALGLTKYRIPTSLMERYQTELPFCRMMMRRNMMANMAARLAERIAPGYQDSKMKPGWVGDIIEEIDMAAGLVHNMERWPVDQQPSTEMLEALVETMLRTERLACTLRFQRAVRNLASEVQRIGSLDGQRMQRIISYSLYSVTTVAL